MSEKVYSIEVFRNVFDDSEGRYLTVRPSPDFPEGSVMIWADSENQDYFGEIRIDLPAGFMRRLGEALIKCADEVEKE